MNPKDPLDHLQDYYQALAQTPVPASAVESPRPIREGALGIVLGAAVAALVLFIATRTNGSPNPNSPTWGIDPGVSAQEPKQKTDRTEVPSWRV